MEAAANATDAVSVFAAAVEAAADAMDAMSVFAVAVVVVEVASAAVLHSLEVVAVCGDLGRLVPVDLVATIVVSAIFSVLVVLQSVFPFASRHTSAISRLY